MSLLLSTTQPCMRIDKNYACIWQAKFRGYTKPNLIYLFDILVPFPPKVVTIRGDPQVKIAQKRYWTTTPEVNKI